MDGQPIGSMGHGRGSKDGQLDWPVGVAFNSHGDVLVGDSMNKRICVFEERSGQCIATFSDRRFGGGWLHVAVDSFDRIIVSDSVSIDWPSLMKDLNRLVSLDRRAINSASSMDHQEFALTRRMAVCWSVKNTTIECRS